MSDTATTRNVLSLIATKSSKLKDIVIKNGQLIFMHDIGRLALDYDNTRVFYNQIVELETEAERLSLDSQLPGYYFVIDTAVLYYYETEWVQITDKPKEVIHIDVELPALGQAKEGVLYVDKTEKMIAVFDKSLNEYIVVSDYTNDTTDEDIEGLFS